MNRRAATSPYGRDPYADTGRKRTRQSAAQRKETVGFAMAGAQSGPGPSPGTGRGDAGSWGRKRSFILRSRRARKTAGGQQGIGGIPGRKARGRRERQSRRVRKGSGR